VLKERRVVPPDVEATLQRLERADGEHLATRYSRAARRIVDA